MRNLTTAAVLAFGGLFFGAGDAAAQAAAITVAAGTPVAPLPGNSNWTYPASGTYTMGAGTTFSKVECEIGYYTARINMPPKWTGILTQTATAANGTYSHDFSIAKDPNKIYFVKSRLYKQGSATVQASAEASY